MIELLNDSLVFSFPEVHPDAELRIEFQRTLRIPDDARTYPLPPGLGPFPLRHIDDYEKRVPKSWVEHGGVMLTMYQSEALWLNFNSTFTDNRARYPFAVKIAAGKINAINGTQWANGLKRKPQNYAVVPVQPWLDGYCVDKGIIRQFVAMPLGEGYSAEEQLTGKADHGGLQIQVYPMKREIFEKYFPKIEPVGHVSFQIGFSVNEPSMGLAPGGRMKQEIYEDPYKPTDWNLDQTSRCFVHIANSIQWKAITGDYPPLEPPTAKQYAAAGLPWFDYYSDGKAIAGAKKLAGLKSMGTLFKQKKKKALQDNETIAVEKIIRLGEKTVREGNF